MEEGFETGLVGAAECLWFSPLLSLVGNDVMTWHPKVLYHSMHGYLFHPLLLR